MEENGKEITSYSQAIFYATKMLTKKIGLEKNESISIVHFVSRSGCLLRDFINWIDGDDIAECSFNGEMEIYGFTLASLYYEHGLSEIEAFLFMAGANQYLDKEF